MTPEIVLLNDLPDYGVTASGAVWSRKYGTWRELKLQKHPKTGYWYLELQIGSVGKTFLVHRLIASAFYGPCPDGFEVNHKDGNKDNNSRNNLEYLPQLDNLKHAWDTGLIVVGKPKLTLEQIVQVRDSYSKGETQASIGKRFLVGPSAISDIVNFRTWKARVHSCAG